MNESNPLAVIGRRAALPLALALALAACASPAGITSSAQMRTAADLGATAKTANWPSDAWWTAYGDAQLSALIEQAVQNNPGIQLAQARLTQARAIEGVADAALLPQMGLSASSTRERFSANDLYPPPLAGSVNSTNSLLIGASYEIDFWGKNRAALDAALSRAAAAQAEAQSARIILATSVARTWFNLARLQAQREVAQATLEQRSKTLALVQQRVSAGLDTNVELRQSEGNLPAARLEIAQLDEQISLTRHALAVLLGQGPHSTESLQARLPAATVASLPAQLPADLIGRRADLAAARLRVQAASGDINVARAQFRPNINLSAFAGFASIGLSRWLQSDSNTWGVTPALSLPIFDAGRLRANLTGKTAELDAAIASYNQTLVQAVNEVADQLSSLQSLQIQIREQQAAQQAAQAALDLATLRYQAGLSTYLTVLTAENAVLAQRHLATDLQARAVDLNVGLVKALGGGFVDPTPAALAINTR